MIDGYIIDSGSVATGLFRHTQHPEALNGARFVHSSGIAGPLPCTLLSAFSSLSVDPLSDKYPSVSAYAYCANNPLNHFDPNGLAPIDRYNRLKGKFERNGTAKNGMRLADFINRKSEKIGRGNANYHNKSNSVQFDVMNTTGEYVPNTSQPIDGMRNISGANIVAGAVFGGNASGGGGDYSWAKNTQTGMGAFNIGNSVKGGMIDYAVASSAVKSMNSLKSADYVATLGKTGANYVKAFKVAGGVTFGVSTLISAGLTYNYYTSGGTGSDVLVKSSLDVTMGVVGLFWPIGTGISATYYIIDAATGGFGGYGDPLKINK